MPRASHQPVGEGLGLDYHKLWAATAISTLGDGMYLAALPLLAALFSGALVDRWDRRRVLWSSP